MIGAGETGAPKKLKVEDVIAVYADSYCPGEGEGECFEYMTKVGNELVEGMTLEQHYEFAGNYFLNATSQIGAGWCNDQFGKSKEKIYDKTRSCFYQSIKVGYESGHEYRKGVWAGNAFMSWLPYLQQAAEAIKAGTTPPEKAEAAEGDGLARVKTPVIPLPQTLRDYGAELINAGLPELAAIAYRLYGEARDDAAYKQEYDPKIVDEIKSQIQPFVNEITAVKDPARKKAITKAATTTLGRLFVPYIVTEGEYEGKPKFVALPDAITNASDSLGPKSEVRGHFKDALKIYKTKPKAMGHVTNPDAGDRDKALNKLAEKLIDALTAAGQGPKKVTDVEVDGDGITTKVVVNEDPSVFADRAADMAVEAAIKAGVPESLIDGLGIRNNLPALKAIRRIWTEAIAKEPKITKNDKERNKAVGTIIAQLAGKSPWRWANAKVASATGGDVKLKDILDDALAAYLDKYATRMTPEAVLAMWRRLLSLIDQAKSSNDRPEEATDRKIVDAVINTHASTVAKHGDDIDDGFEEFYKLRFAGFDSKTKDPIFKVVGGGKGDKPDWLKYKVDLRGYTNFDDFSGLLSGEIGGLHHVGSDIGFSWMLGLKSGTEMDKFGKTRQSYIDNADYLLQKSPGNKKWSVLPKGLLGVKSLKKPEVDETVFNWGLDAGIGFEPDYTESNFVGVWATGSLLSSDIGSLSLRVGGGGLATIDASGEGKSDVGPAFVDVKLSGGSKLWEGASMEAWLWYMHAMKATSPDVFALDLAVTQELPERFKIAAELLYGTDIGDDVPESSVTFFNPVIGWRSADVTGNFAFDIGANYDLLKVTGAAIRHGIGPEIGLSNEDGSIGFKIGYKYYMQGSSDPVSFDRGNTLNTGDTRTVSDPGGEAHRVFLQLIVKD